MALGGGTYLVQNKLLPGAYINFVSASRASATLSDRGTATFPLSLDWGPEGEVLQSKTRTSSATALSCSAMRIRTMRCVRCVRSSRTHRPCMCSD